MSPLPKGVGIASPVRLPAGVFDPSPPPNPNISLLLARGPVFFLCHWILLPLLRPGFFPLSCILLLLPASAISIRFAVSFEMVESSFINRMLSHLQELSRYYTGHPKDFGPSRIIHFTSERQFIQLLHEGQPVAVAFTIKCPYTKHFDSILEEAAAEFYPNIRFVRVECPKYPGFCIARQKKDYPFIEIFYSPEEAANNTKVVDPNITKYSVKVLPYNYDLSTYGFGEFFKKHGIYSSNNK